MRYLKSECVICFANIENVQDIRLLNCQHLFHDECIDKWLQKKPSCPVCKKEFKKERQLKVFVRNQEDPCIPAICGVQSDPGEPFDWLEEKKLKKSNKKM